MSIATDTKALRAFVFHGLDLGGREDGQAAGLCPFCRHDARKFRVNLETGLWDCKNCGASGNPLTFLRQLYEAAGEPDANDLAELAEDRGLSPEALLAWGARTSPVSGEWMMPAWDAKGELHNLYRYCPDPKTGKRRLIVTPGAWEEGKAHGLFGTFALPKTSGEKGKGEGAVYFCEGPWDGAALWQALRRAKKGGTVYATPGANVFRQDWLGLFAGKALAVLYDNDHPRQVGKGMVDGAGLVGTRTVCGSALGIASSVRWLMWGPEGHDPELPSGYDVRDLLASSQDGKGLGLIEDLMETAPLEWKAAARAAKGGQALRPMPCGSWQELVDDWRLAMKWPPRGQGLDHALSVMLASVVSVEAQGDQLWVKVMGPPSCGKSTLCEALATANQYVFSASTITGFHSGYKSDKEGKEDHGLVPKLRGKTLVVKDGDTILQAPNMVQILSEARDLYDCVARAHYRHGVSRNYDGVRFTWVLCGTAALRALDKSELGARFLDCKIMDAIDEAAEAEINRRVVDKVRRNLGAMANGHAESQNDPALVRAMRKTGGYVEHLRKNAEGLLRKVTITDRAGEQCERWGTFVAYVRARPSIKQDELVERELSARLVGQLCRLAGCLAAVLGKRETDAEVMARVRKVALDTAAGKALDIVRHLRRAEDREGLSLSALASWVHLSEDKTRAWTGFLTQLGIVRAWKPERKGMMAVSPRWRLTPKMLALFDEIDADRL